MGGMGPRRVDRRNGKQDGKKGKVGGSRGPALRRNVFSMANEGLKRWRINGRSGVPVQH